MARKDNVKIKRISRKSKGESKYRRARQLMIELTKKLQKVPFLRKEKRARILKQIEQHQNIVRLAPPKLANELRKLDAIRLENMQLRRKALLEGTAA